MKTLQFSIHLICVISFVELVQAVNTFQQGYSNLQYGQRLENAMINSYGEFSFLDCVKECLVTMRCKSVNYFKGANYCETNYEDKASAVDKFTTKTGWVYSERAHWPEELTKPCSQSSCAINEKCQVNRYSEGLTFSCVLSDCGLPSVYGLNLSTLQEWDAIGVNRAMHVRCMEGRSQFGSERLICRPTGQWHIKILCMDGVWFQFENHIYYFFDEYGTWADKKYLCGRLRAYLAEINTLKEKQWITQQLPEMAYYYDDIWTCRVQIGGINPGIGEARPFTQPADCTDHFLRSLFVCETELP